MNQEEVSINSAALDIESVGSTVSWNIEGAVYRLSFLSSEGSKMEFTSTLELADGRTVGQANRERMHAHLDAWIERVCK